MRIKVNDSGRKIELDVRKIRWWEEGIGLTFKTKNTQNILFELKKESRMSLTGMFVFFPFLILWLDEKNNVVEKKIARPFEFSIKPKKSFRKVVEVPVNQQNAQIIDFFVGKGRKV